MIKTESVSSSTRGKTSEMEVSTAKVTNNYMGEFYQLRSDLLLGTILVALVGSILARLFFGWHTSLNYLLGAGFGLVYLNMLARAVEKISQKKKGTGWTRLALFVGLIIVASKMPTLEILPIFVGFITYKVTILFYFLPRNLLGGINKLENKIIE